MTASLKPNYGQREALSISKLALEESFGWREIDFILEANQIINIDQSILDKLIKELTANKPVQYVLGKTHFAGLEFEVGEGVLIPRPETEELVQWINSEHNQGKVLDIGTGSGAIAITLAKSEKFTLTALDISEQALDIASRNAQKHNTKINFEQVDILNPRAEFALRNFDIIVSNPPYIPLSEKQDMSPNVTDYEPGLALFVPDSDPLLFYREIALLAKTMLVEGGWLYYELHENYAEQTLQLVESLGFECAELRVDIHDKPRMLRCQRTH